MKIILVSFHYTKHVDIFDRNLIILKTFKNMKDLSNLSSDFSKTTA